MQHWEKEKWKYDPVNTNLAMKKKTDTLNKM